MLIPVGPGHAWAWLMGGRVVLGGFTRGSRLDACIEARAALLAFEAIVPG